MPAKSTSRNDLTELKSVIEAALMASDVPLSVRKIRNMFDEAERPDQTKDQYSGWLRKLRDTRPPRYSRALIETLSIIAYRQPVTRGDIEGIRGVAVSSDIMRLLLDREWITQIGHRDVPGRPALYATSDSFLEYFNLRSLSDLPALMEPRDVSDVAKDLNITLPMEQPQLKSLADVLDDADLDDDEELLNALPDVETDNSDSDSAASDNRPQNDRESDAESVDAFDDHPENSDSEESSGDSKSDNSKIVLLEKTASGVDQGTSREVDVEEAAVTDSVNDDAEVSAREQSTGADLRVVPDGAEPSDAAVIDFSDLDALPAVDEDDTEQTPIQVIDTRKNNDFESQVDSNDALESDANDDDNVDTPTDPAPDDSL